MPKIHTLNIFKGVVAGGSQGLDKELITGSLLQILLIITTIIIPLGVLSWFAILRFKKSLSLGIAMTGVTAMYILIGLHWLVSDLSSSEIIKVSDTLLEFIRLQVPRLVYGMSLLLMLTAYILRKYCNGGFDDNVTNYIQLVSTESIALIAGASGIVILLMGRKGPLLALLAVLQGRPEFVKILNQCQLTDPIPFVVIFQTILNSIVTKRISAYLQLILSTTSSCRLATTGAQNVEFSCGLSFLYSSAFLGTSKCDKIK
jgi:hypothetical protein